MKRLVAVLFATLAICQYAGAQGQITYLTFGGGVNASMTNGLTGVKAVGTDYYSALFYGKVGTAEDALVQAGATATLNAAGYVSSASGGGVRLTDPLALDANQAGIFQVRGWSAVLGNNYQTAFDTWRAGTIPTAVLGKSNLVPQTPSAAPAPAPVLTGLQNFTLQPVPEPSVIALGALGLAAILYRRRK